MLTNSSGFEESEKWWPPSKERLQSGYFVIWREEILANSKRSVFEVQRCMMGSEPLRNCTYTDVLRSCPSIDAREAGGGVSVRNFRKSGTFCRIEETSQFLASWYY